MRLKARAGDGTKTAVGSTEVERNLFVCIELLVSETMSKYMKLRITKTFFRVGSFEIQPFQDPCLLFRDRLEILS